MESAISLWDCVIAAAAEATPVEGVTVEKFLPGVSVSVGGMEGDGRGGGSSTDLRS